MKTLLSSTLRAACLLALIGSAHAANLLTNGSFQLDTVGTTIGSGLNNPLMADATFVDWRFFSVGNGPGGTPISGVGGLIGTADQWGGGGSSSLHVFRFDVNNSGVPPVANDFALDRANTLVAVSFGTTYTFSYDAALYGLTGGTFMLQATLAEYNGSSFTGTQASYNPSISSTFTTKSFTWTPQNSATTQINIAFRPMTEFGFASATGITNVSLTAVPEPGTISLLALAGAAGAWFLRKRRSV